ncbi:hypothetical protein CTI12_AA324730 [Artemisia annua]|uniref:Uncharacterized protein n=1 Tax=Artemisia annua TaxID=35608 RepID=A0A2U1MZM1_ARTAN|nr:hypothetical protein CTI12_AA324730 [Artemisia annua]
MSLNLPDFAEIVLQTRHINPNLENLHSSHSPEKEVRIIPGPASIVQLAKRRKQADISEGHQERVISTQEYIRTVLEDVEVDEDFSRGPWLSAVDFVNANGGCGSGVAGGGMLDEEIMKLLEEEEQAEQEWRNRGYLIEQQEHEMRLGQEALRQSLAEEARAKQEEEERLRKEREEAWELGLSGYVSDSFFDSSEEERFRIEPEEDWELGWCGYVSDSFTDTD